MHEPKSVSSVLDHISRLLDDSFRKNIEELRKSIKEREIVAYAFYSTDGFDAIGVAALTKTKYQEIVSSDEPYLFAFGSEWDIVNCNSNFDELNEEVYSFRSSCFDGDFDIDYSKYPLDSEELLDYVDNLILERIEGSLKNLRDAGLMSEKPFESDVLLCVQFTDYGESMFKKFEKVARNLNSTFWSSRLVKAYQDALK